MNEAVKEVVEHLKSLGLRSISKDDLKMIEALLISSKNNINKIKKELSLLYHTNRVMLNTYKEVSLNNMKRINDETDLGLLIELFNLYNNISMKDLEENKIHRIFIDYASDVIARNKKANIYMKGLALEHFKNSVNVRDSLYVTMNDQNKAQELYDNCLRRLSSFLDNANRDNMEELILMLKKDFKFNEK